MCRYGVEKEGGYVSICRYMSIWGGGRGRICVDMCRYGVEEEEGEELGESYVVRSKHMSIIVLFYIGTQIINTYYEIFCIL
jgi:hypothetical protein